MIINANSVPKDSLLEADVVIVGTGAAGLSLAFKFADVPLKIIMIESGKMTIDDKLQELNNFELTGLAIEKLSRARSFGGTTTLWGGKWIPFDDIDFSHRDWIPYSGWPISRQDLDQYYQEADKLLGLPILSDKEGNLLQSEKLKTYSFQNVREEYLDFGKRFNELISNAKNIEVYLEATVVGLGCHNDTLEELAIKTLEGNQFKVKGQTVILACGGIENARLLLLNKIGNQYDQVGRYYMDHPKGDAGIITFHHPRGDISQSVGLGLSDTAQRENKALNSHILFFPKYKRDQILEKWPRIPRGIVRRILNLLLGKPTQISSYVIKNYMEQTPHPNNRITLAETFDAFGNRLPKIHWTISNLDKHSMITLHKILKAELEDKKLGTLKSPLLETLVSWPLSTDAAHHMGTTRMGNDPQTSVVDKDCRVHSVRNLYLAGSSVFPTGGTSSPTTTIIALALRLADHVANKT